ncbi:hypothetical protein BD289DRAFT_76472 [Coniella lustricola]|uniref:Uncharacterized protein n=1 Tax=Coniella lustricola TaxID=2025994 RepID=A0A2T2ZZJ8_9PEZI|nr:hypothetical protein BD289DRAFT_76472 [Coniella lustricola]
MGRDFSFLYPVDAGRYVDAFHKDENKTGRDEAQNGISCIEGCTNATVVSTELCNIAWWHMCAPKAMGSVNPKSALCFVFRLLHFRYSVWQSLTQPHVTQGYIYRSIIAGRESCSCRFALHLESRNTLTCAQDIRRTFAGRIDSRQQNMQLPSCEQLEGVEILNGFPFSAAVIEKSRVHPYLLFLWLKIALP